MHDPVLWGILLRSQSPGSHAEGQCPDDSKQTATERCTRSPITCECVCACVQALASTCRSMQCVQWRVPKPRHQTLHTWKPTKSMIVRMDRLSNQGHRQSPGLRQLMPRSADSIHRPGQRHRQQSGLDTGRYKIAVGAGRPLSITSLRLPRRRALPTDGQLNGSARVGRHDSIRVTRKQEKPCRQVPIRMIAHMHWRMPCAALPAPCTSGTVGSAPRKHSSRHSRSLGDRGITLQFRKVANTTCLEHLTPKTKALVSRVPSRHQEAPGQRQTTLSGYGCTSPPRSSASR